MFWCFKCVCYCWRFINEQWLYECYTYYWLTNNSWKLGVYQVRTCYKCLTVCSIITTNTVNMCVNDILVISIWFLYSYFFHSIPIFIIYLWPHKIWYQLPNFEPVFVVLGTLDCVCSFQPKSLSLPGCEEYQYLDLLYS